MLLGGASWPDRERPLRLLSMVKPLPEEIKDAAEGEKQFLSGFPHKSAGSGADDP